MILHKAKKFFSSRSSQSSVSHNTLEVLYSTFGYTTCMSSKGIKPIKLDVVVQDGKSLPKSSAFIRLIAPLTNSVIADKVSLNICQDISNLREDVRVIIIQRAVLNSVKEVEKLIKHAKEYNTKLIVDTDDAFFNLDNKHPDYKYLYKRNDALMYLIKKADQLWVSTDNLKSYYKKNSDTPIYVMPNALDPRVWKKNNVKELPARSALNILYMGTATHEEDFQMIVPWLDKLHKKYPNSFELHVIGVSTKLPKRPWLRPLTRKPNTVLYPNFAKWIQSEGPFDIGLAPLVNSTFNKYKSDVKCLDYIAVGAVPMVSDIEPYSNEELNGLIFRNSNTEEGWFKSLEEIILDLPKFRQRRLEILKQGQHYIWQKRSSEIAAKQIAKLLEIN